MGFRESTEPGLESLTQLQEAHLLNIPFENLDIHYGIPIELDIDKIYQKIIIDKRGGFCYELNGLFYELITALGFNAKRVSARVFNKDKGYGPEFDHLAIIVDINGAEYLADVGFGEFAFAPLQLQPGMIQKDQRGDFIIELHDDNYYRVSKIEEGQAIPSYIFSTIPRELSEFEEMCLYQQTSPESHFTQKPIISLPLHGGRISLAGDLLKIKKGEAVFETPVENRKVFEQLLKHYFGIELAVRSQQSGVVYGNVKSKI